MPTDTPTYPITLPAAGDDARSSLSLASTSPPSCTATATHA
jgi:hypothetical protein